MESKARFAFELDRRLVEKLDRIAERLGKTVDELVEAVLWDYVRRFERMFGSLD